LSPDIQAKSLGFVQDIGSNTFSIEEEVDTDIICDG
jgi:hypothetical protein